MPFEDLQAHLKALADEGKAVLASGAALPPNANAFIVKATAELPKVDAALDAITNAADQADALLDGLDGTPAQVKEVLKAALRTIFRLSNTVQNGDALISEVRGLVADTRAEGLTITITFPKENGT
jgi:ABC-type transporter Mla subunit MlaD